MSNNNNLNNLNNNNNNNNNNNDNNNQVNSWSFVTLVRIRPLPNLHSNRGGIDYRITEGKSNEYKNNFKFLELQIPPGADPGLVHNNKSGFIGFSFNDILDANSTQEDIFNHVVDMVVDIFDGINSTIFAYGQTGSGKTYSMCGGDSYHERGLIPRTLNLVFEELLYHQQHDPSTTYKCLISFTEIFGEAIYDLLDQNKRFQPIEEWPKVQIYENEDGLVLRNINVFEVSTEEEALNLFFMGTTNRSTSSTPMNHASSRSHAIFTIVIESEGITDNRIVTKLGKINLVDLAGSERLYKTENNKSMIKEGKQINLSLHYLEQVIISLREQNKKQNSNKKIQRANSTPITLSSDGKYSLNPHIFGNGTPSPSSITSSSHHIPYRNSLLTNILRDSLGGNCKSCFLLTISMDSEYFEETISTMRFGQRCGEIQVKVHANLEIDVKSQLREALSRITELEHQIKVYEDERIHLFKSLEEKEEILTSLTEEEVKGLSEEEIELSERIAQLINDKMSHHEENDMNSIKQIIHQELKGFRKPILFEITTRLSTILSTAYKEITRLTNETKLTHRKIFQENRSLSMDSKFDDDDHPGLETIQSSSPRQGSIGSNGYLETNLTVSASVESPTHSIKPFLFKEPSTKTGISKKLKPLLDGTTIISHGTFGSKLKTLSLSPDGKYISWKELMKEKEAKTFLLSECESFRIIERKNKKVHGGVMVAFTDGSKKTHEFEFPPGTCTEEENNVRVTKWVDLINDLRVGKMSVLLEPGSLKSIMSSQMRATQINTSSRQISFNSDVETVER